MTDGCDNTKLDNIELEIEPTKVSRSTQTQSHTQTIDKEEFDRRCSRYSTAGFLLGVFAVVVYGVATI